MATEKVYPSNIVPQHKVKLSVTDCYSPKVWVTQCHFFKLDDTHDFERVAETLRQGLSRTLSELPGFAGTIERASSDPRDLFVNVAADAHVDFICEDLSFTQEIPSYASLEERHFPMTGLVAAFSAPITLTTIYEGVQMFATKLNRIRGGAVLTFGFNHLLADASTVAEVERVWSMHTADVSHERPQQKYAGSTDDDEVRRRLSTAVQDAAKFEDPLWKVFPTNVTQLNLPTSPPVREAALEMVHKAKDAIAAAETGETKWSVWYFSPASLAKLKADASGGGPGWISTMDALIGLFWSRISCIKQCSKDGHEKSELIFPANIRQRLQPPVPSDFHGNCVDLITGSCALADLEDPATRGIQTAAQSVRNTVSSWSQAKWQSWLTMGCELPNDQAICVNPLILLESRNLACNDYSKSRSHTLDWGKDLGRVQRTRYMKPAGSMAGCATAMVVHPRLADGGLEIMTTSTDQVREALLKDEAFNKYAKLNCAFA